MLNTLKYIYVIGIIFGLIIVGIAFLRFKKTLEEHRKTSNDDSLSENEKILQNKSIKIMIIGFLIIGVTFLIQLYFLYNR